MINLRGIFTLCGFALLLTPIAIARAAPRAKPLSDPGPPPFASDIAAFAAADKARPPAPGGALFIGSSSIRLWTTLAADFPELPTLNRGFGGSQIADSVRYADQIVIPYKPRMIVFSAGGNDLDAGKSPAQVLAGFQAFAAEVHAALPQTGIAYLSTKPTLARWRQEAQTLQANRLIETFIQQSHSTAEHLLFIDSHAPLLGPDQKPLPGLLRADGLHLNAKGYKVWTAIVRPPLLKFWNECAPL